MAGGTYGLMCVGLGLIFGVMRVINFAQGEFMMLGMYCAYYLVTGFGILLFMGPYAAPIVGALLAGPIVFVIGWLLHRYLIAQVTGARVVSAEAEGHYAQIILTLGVALVLANGGLIGTGLGQGRPDLTPVPQSDYIIASLGEELGLAGVFASLALYVLFVARGFRIGFAGQDDFGKLLGVGLAFVVALQVFIVVGGVTRVIPLTGLTTPFLAAGGSSLVANWIIVALLLRLSDTVRNHPRLVIDG